MKLIEYQNMRGGKVVFKVSPPFRPDGPTCAVVSLNLGFFPAGCRKALQDGVDFLHRGRGGRPWSGEDGEPEPARPPQEGRQSRRRTDDRFHRG